MKAKDWPRLVMSGFILALLGYAAWFHYSPGSEETIKAIVLIAVGYWLGSSEGSKEKTELMAGTQKVEVTNTKDKPVPTEEE